MDCGQYREVAKPAMLKFEMHGRVHGRSRVRSSAIQVGQTHSAGRGARHNERKRFRTPKINLLQGDQKRSLTPGERERRKKLDDDYKAATNKIPNQKAADP
jgi:hypothetical protein